MLLVQRMRKPGKQDTMSRKGVIRDTQSRLDIVAVPKTFSAYRMARSIDAGTPRHSPVPDRGKAVLMDQNSNQLIFVSATMSRMDAKRRYGVDSVVVAYSDRDSRTFCIHDGRDFFRRRYRAQLDSTGGSDVSKPGQF